jgi:hypothetical protein
MVSKSYIKYHFSDFTRDNYRKIIRLAKKNYIVRDFINYKENEKFIILRHDMDYSVNSSLKLALIEKEEKVKSTYFVYIHSFLYNILEKRIHDLLLQIIRLGHNVGLHFDCNFYSRKAVKDMESFITKEKDLLEDYLKTKIKVVSFHNPINIKDFSKHYLAGMINVYSDYFMNKIDYISDSNGYWRFRRLEDVIKEANKPLQVLIHPEYWTDQVMSPKERIWRCIEGRADNSRDAFLEIMKQTKRRMID